MNPISVVIIAYNEERSIVRCIESVKSFADDILVVDSYSTDRTVALAVACGARVDQHPFEGHIEQKNYAITRAVHPYILSLDADEWLDETAAKEVKRIKDFMDADGYVFNRLNSYCGKWIRHGAWYPDRKLRLWDSRLGKWEGMNPHDEFRMKKGAVIKRLRGNILHESYRSIDEHKAKSIVYSELAAEAYQRNHKPAGWLRIIFSPLIRFVRDYIIRLGCLDGKYGLIIAWLTAAEVRRKYVRLHERYQQP